jgi:microcystin-dependent protein
MGGTAANRLPGFSGVSGMFGTQTHTLTNAEMPSHQHAVFLKDPQHTHTESGTVSVGSVGTNAVISNVAGPPAAGIIQPSSTGLTIGSVNGVANDNQTALLGGGGAMSLVQPTSTRNMIIKR